MTERASARPPGAGQPLEYQGPRPADQDALRRRRLRAHLVLAAVGIGYAAVNAVALSVAPGKVFDLVPLFAWGAAALGVAALAVGLLPRPRPFHPLATV